MMLQLMNECVSEIIYKQIVHLLVDARVQSVYMLFQIDYGPLVGIHSVSVVSRQTR